MDILKIFKKEKLQVINVGKVKSAVLEIKTNIINNCASYDPFGLCTVNDCLQCENCVYRLSFDNGQIVETDDFEKYSMDSEYDKYSLEFIEPINGDIFEYLINDESDYRIIRVKDNEIMRFSKEEQLKEIGCVSSESGSKTDKPNGKRLAFKKI